MDFEKDATGLTGALAEGMTGVDIEETEEIARLDGAAAEDLAGAGNETAEDLEELALLDGADEENLAEEAEELSDMDSVPEAEPDTSDEEAAEELEALDEAESEEPGPDAVDGDIEEDISAAQDTETGLYSEKETQNIVPETGTLSETGTVSETGMVSETGVVSETGTLSETGAVSETGEAASATTKSFVKPTENIFAGKGGRNVSQTVGEDTEETEETESGDKKVKMVSVGFRNAGKKLYYRTGGYDLHIGDKVIVETVRGIEMGSVVMPPMLMDPNKLHIRPDAIIRPANEIDQNQAAENRAREREAYHVCKQKIGEHGLDMKLVQAEYTFDRSKLIFYFTADGRVDFRGLLKDLASTFHTRIELRQIGVRDETRVLGGIGVCGREVCCKTYLRTFAPVSVKMAKEQNLSLNPTKISGLCGRLMCCLKNEEETYEYLNRAMPRLGSRVQTKEGETGVVKSIDILKQKASVLFEENDEREMRVYNVSDLVFRSFRGKREEGAGEAPFTDTAAAAEATADAGEMTLNSGFDDNNNAAGQDGGEPRASRPDGRRNGTGDRKKDGNRGGRGRRNDNRHGDHKDRGNRPPRSEGEGSEGQSAEGRPNGGYSRGYGSSRSEESSSGEGRANGGYSRGYRDDFSKDGDGEHKSGDSDRRSGDGDRRSGDSDRKSGDRRNNHGRNRRNDRNSGRGRSGSRSRDASDTQRNGENRRPAEEQS